MKQYSLFLPPNTSEDDIRAAIAQVGPIHFQDVEHSPVFIPDSGDFIHVTLRATNDGAYDRLRRKLGSVEP
jgi:hypothetical protein